MPQMAPLSWLTLMLLFLMILIMFNILNYYSILYTPLTKTTKMPKKNIKLTWTW